MLLFHYGFKILDLQKMNKINCYLTEKKVHQRETLSLIRIFFPHTVEGNKEFITYELIHFPPSY